MNKGVVNVFKIGFHFIYALYRQCAADVLWDLWLFSPPCVYFVNGCSSNDCSLHYFSLSNEWIVKRIAFITLRGLFKRAYDLKPLFLHALKKNRFCFFLFLTLHSFQKPGPAEMGQKHTRFCNFEYYPIACWHMCACVHLRKKIKYVCIYFFNIHIYILC